MPTFSNRFYDAMPKDPNPENYVRQVSRAMFSDVRPTAVSNPRLLGISMDMAEKLGWTQEDVLSAKFTQVMAGNDSFEGMKTYAHRYGGHQFGHWAGQLGDGRAIALGEIHHNQKHWELQLKGAGITPYSRMGDGRAVLRSSLREFVCSEAMQALGIPTTRALSLVLTGDSVVRDMFYDGNAEDEPGAIVCRVAESFLRFGSFEIFSAYNDIDNLKRLMDFVLRTYYPEIPFTGDTDRPKAVTNFFHTLAERTADLIVDWMSVGFVHGVMNTDNMSILGLTLDYGPYGWLDIVDSGWTPNTSDNHRRRYAFGNQPNVGAWNLMKLAEALYPMVESVEPLQEGLEHYQQHFQQRYTEKRFQKLGFTLQRSEAKASSVNRLYELMEQTETDFTILFRTLSELSIASVQSSTTPKERTQLISQAFYQYETWTEELHERWSSWLEKYVEILVSEGREEALRHQEMKQVNPKFIFRNYLAQVVIDDLVAGRTETLESLQRVLQRPFDEHPEHEQWAQRMPEWARNRAGCSALSCSS